VSIAVTAVTTSNSPTGTTTVAAVTTPTVPKGRLSTSAKAGIAVAIVIFSAVLLLIILFLFRRRMQRKSRTPEATEKAVPPNTHELLTNANSHELFTKYNVPEMDEQDSGVLKPKAKLVSVVADVWPDNEDPVPREDLTGVHEFDPESHIKTLGGDDYLPSVQELEISDPRSGHRSVRPAEPSGIRALQGRTDTRATSSTDEPPLVSEERERKVELLKDRINRIREEREWLERIQELKDLEEQTKRDIIEASRNS
jgi:hypothetical protein